MRVVLTAGSSDLLAVIVAILWGIKNAEETGLLVSTHICTVYIRGHG